MEKRTLISLIFNIVLAAAIVVVGVWGYTNFDKVQSLVSGAGGNLHTDEDLQKSFDDGYNTALENKNEYDNLISGYRDTITGLNDTVSRLNGDIQKAQRTIGELTSTNDNKTATIAALNGQIAALQNSVSNLTAQVTTLTTSVGNLTNDNIELQTALTSLQLQSSSFTVTINQLNSLVTYLSGIITDWEDRTEFTVTFYVNGEIWDVQVISNPAIKPTIPTAPAGDFNFVGWSLDGTTVIDPAQISVVSDIQFHAVLTATVQFVSDGAVIETQTVAYGGNVTNAPTPTKDGYNFTGWDSDTTQPITAHKTFTAQWELKTYSVTFVSDGVTLKSETVNHGTVATAPAIPTKEGYNFMGWDKDVTSPIIGNTTFNAVWEIKTYTVSFVTNRMPGYVTVTEIVEHGKTPTMVPNFGSVGSGMGGQYHNGWIKSTLPLMGWKNRNDVALPITEDTVFIAIWTINGSGSTVAD